MTCRWVRAAVTRARPPQRCHRKRSWEKVRLRSSAQHMVDDGAEASCLGCNFRSFAMRRHADDLGAIFGVCGKEAAVNDFVLTGSWHELRDAPDEGLRREVQDAADIA